MIAGRDGMDPPPSLAGLPVEESVKCLGIWWCSTGSLLKNIFAKHTEHSSCLLQIEMILTLIAKRH